MKKVCVVDYKPSWLSNFEAEQKTLQHTFLDQAISINHIGSTSIPNLAAKPVIDILIEAKDINNVDELNNTLEALGYQAKGEFGMPGRRFFIKNDASGERSYQIHVFETGNKELHRHLTFRDYMRAHPEEAVVYGNLKKELAKEFPHDIHAYCCGKDAYIKGIDKKAAEWQDPSPR